MYEVPSAKPPAATWRIIWSMTWRGTVYGVLAGVLCGGIYGAGFAIVIEGLNVLFLGGLIGAAIGGGAGFGFGFALGFVLGFVTWWRFRTLPDPATYRRALTLIGVGGTFVLGTLYTLASFAPQLSIAQLFDWEFVWIVGIPGAIILLWSWWCSMRLARWHLERTLQPSPVQSFFSR